MGTIAAAVTALVAALTGCAGSPSDSDGSSATPAAESAGPEPTGTVTVFAAASLTEVFDALAERFEQQNPRVDVVLNYGGSSALSQQIVQGAPVDVFAAANESTMTTVTDAGLAADPTIFTTNTLELVVPAGNPAGITGLADLARPELAIALCDPAVPCGSAAAQLLTLAGITASPDTLEEDVKAVATKVSLGEADAGLVYRTDVIAAGDAVEGIRVPEAADVVNRYPIVALSAAPNPDAAAAFVTFVLSETGRSALTDAGFGAP